MKRLDLRACNRLRWIRCKLPPEALTDRCQRSSFMPACNGCAGYARKLPPEALTEARQGGQGRQLGRRGAVNAIAKLPAEAFVKYLPAKYAAQGRH